MLRKSIVLSSFLLASTLTYAQTDFSINQYRVMSKNSARLILESRNAVILLEKSCDAKSPQFGRGTWGWASGVIIIQFVDKQISVLRQELPFEDGSCSL